ncbi:MAG: hypothetical protein ACRD9L_25235, partial [Bryobacteraceae bacterium]
MRWNRAAGALAVALCLAPGCFGQVYSPVVLKSGQVDTTDLAALARGIYTQAGARTQREKAEAIWRFFLTDGRFVKPGFWYHIVGWTFEEPDGEVLDPIKLLNSYGFGLCYHIAPLLAAVWKAGGFEDSRVWFLTGHTVAEVFYYGQYHYYDSDMMGYNPIGSEPLKERPVASVHRIEENGNIILGKLIGPKQADPAAVDNPWYPADVRADAIGGLAELFTTTKDNRLYAFTRYSGGHTMDFVLRPGERMIRYYRPQPPGLYYLPYKFDGTAWREFPQEIAHYHIRTADGPKSQKDHRTWATGKIEYRPPLSGLKTGARTGGDPTLIVPMPCPYVIIDAQFTMDVDLPASGDALAIDTSVDGGRTWTRGAGIHGPFRGAWNAAPGAIVKSEHGQLTAVSGTYGYLVRLTLHRSHSGERIGLHNMLLTTRFELNPRSLPELTAGRNEFHYRACRRIRTELPVRADRLEGFATELASVRFDSHGAQGYLVNRTRESAEIVLPVAAPDGGEIRGFDAGGRFLDLRDGFAPDKFTAELRRVTPWPAKDASAPEADLSWGTSPTGPYHTLWTYNAKLTWKDGQPIDRTLRWPEVDRHVNAVPPGTRRVYVRYRLCGIALDK